MYALCSKLKVQNAAVAELADAQDLKSCGTYTPVPVRFRSAAPYKCKKRPLLERNISADEVHQTTDLRVKVLNNRE